MIPFDLEYQYQHYLRRAQISEDKMSPLERVQTKRAFMGGCSAMLVIYCKEIKKHKPDDVSICLSDMIHEAAAYWESQNKKTI